MKRQESSMPLTTGFAQVNGTTLYYEVLGDGPALVLIHGGLLDCRLWDPQFSALAQQYRVLRYDIRGHGKSERSPGEFEFHRDLYELMNYLQIEQACLIGQSGGGRTAITFALEFPARVKALVLVASGLAGYAFSPETLQTFADYAAARQQGEHEQATEIFMRRWIDGPGQASERINPLVRAQVRAMMLDNYRRPAEPTMIPREPDATARLSEIRVPTLCVIGDKDVPELHAIADLLVTSIPGARKIILAGAHVVNMEQPEVFNQQVREFLAAAMSRHTPGSQR